MNLGLWVALRLAPVLRDELAALRSGDEAREQLVTNDRPDRRPGSELVKEMQSDPELDRTLSAVNDAINQPGE